LSVLLIVAGSLTSAGACVASTSPVMQSATATLTGVVVDENDAAVAGVDIALTNRDTGLQRQQVTNFQGYFRFPMVSPGLYHVSAKRQGFKTLEVDEVVLNVNEQRTLPLRLTVGEISETVTVQRASLIQTESAAVSTVVDRQFVENLPLNGRSF